MKYNRHFLKRTFGNNWKTLFPLFIVLSLIVAFLPTFLFIKKIELNVPKFCEEWLKSVLSLSAIFFIANYLNFFINVNRSRDKISMLINNFNIVGNGAFQKMSDSTISRNEILNLIITLENLLNKIQSEDEFLYKVEGLSEFSGHENYFTKLKSHINSGPLTLEQIATLQKDFDSIKNYLNKYL